MSAERIIFEDSADRESWTRDQLKPGDLVKFPVSAPGIGKVAYRVTRVDPATGRVYGQYDEDNTTAREMEPWEAM